MKNFLILLISILLFVQICYSQNYWQQTSLTNTEIWSLASNSNGHIFAGLTFNRGIKRTTDNGQTWTQVLNLLPSPPNKWIYSIAINQKGYVFAAVESYGGVVRSTNNGVNWTLSNFSSYNINSIATNSYGYIFAGGDGIYRSTDNGDSWIQFNLSNLGVWSLAINQNNNYIYAGMSDGSIYRSTNNGNNWTPMYTIINSYARCLTESPNGYIYAGCQNNTKIYRSTNDGIIWTEVLSNGNDYFVSTLKSNQLNHIYAGTSNGGVYCSTDNGNSWIQVNSGLNDMNVRALTVDAYGFVYAGSYAGVARSTVSTTPSININLSILDEGKYNNLFDLLTQRDTIIAYLRSSAIPYNIIDSSKGVIDSLSFSQIFSFYNSPSGIYYISVINKQCIETWSKNGGESLTINDVPIHYNFTSAATQAYGNNLKLKGSKYCMYSGDVNQDRYITLFDVIPIYNDATNFITGRYLSTDLNGDSIVDLTDVTLCYNNSTNFIEVMSP